MKCGGLEKEARPIHGVFHRKSQRIEDIHESNGENLKLMQKKT